MSLPKGFVYLKDIDASIIQENRYFSNNNFVGRHIPGYTSKDCVITHAAAMALAKLQQELKKKSLSLKVFDCYRPQRAVDYFIDWSADLNDQKMKTEYYPNVDKHDLFKLGYLAEKSGHSRGSTVDLTLVHLNPGHLPLELDMGTHFDYLDELSFPLNPSITGQAHRNRILLRNLMHTAGFEPYDKEWWHFTLRNEPYHEEYFDFVLP